jgi:hypothetical protein
MDAPKVSVEALLSEDAKKSLDRNQVELVARGLLRPNAGMVQRLAIEFLKSESDFESRETRWANDFRRMENRLGRFLERAENAEKTADALRNMLKIQVE